MINETKPQKPRAVLYAEWLLWVWATWVCLFGMYEAWSGLPKMVQTINEQSQGMFTIDPQTLLRWMVASSLLEAGLSVWFIFKIGQGKHWARSSLLWCFLLEAVWTACSPFQDKAEYIKDIPDFALQAFAIYLLYTSPGKSWFPKK